MPVKSKTVLKTALSLIIKPLHDSMSQNYPSYEGDWLIGLALCRRNYLICIIISSSLLYKTIFSIADIIAGTITNTASVRPVTCTFTNAQRADLTIGVNVIGFALGTEFDFGTQGGLTPPSFSLQPGETQTFSNLLPGQTYTVNKQSPSNWALDEVICSEPVCQTGSVIITPEPGQNITATFRFRGSMAGEAEPQNIPTLNHWGLGGLIGLFGLALTAGKVLIPSVRKLNLSGRYTDKFTVLSCFGIRAPEKLRNP
ncbi:MAG: hypothetical protein R3F53_20360 [Gammaproteobacteria bacterium]